MCVKGWQVAGIKEAFQKGLSGFPLLDPFHDSDPLSITSTVDETTVEDGLVDNQFMYITDMYSTCRLQHLGRQ